MTTSGTRYITMTIIGGSRSLLNLVNGFWYQIYNSDSLFKKSDGSICARRQSSAWVEVIIQVATSKFDWSSLGSSTFSLEVFDQILVTFGHFYMKNVAFLRLFVFSQLCFLAFEFLWFISLFLPYPENDRCQDE